MKTFIPKCWIISSPFIRSGIFYKISRLLPSPSPSRVCVQNLIRKEPEDSCVLFWTIAMCYYIKFKPLNQKYNKQQLNNNNKQQTKTKLSHHPIISQNVNNLVPRNSIQSLEKFIQWFWCGNLAFSEKLSQHCVGRDGRTLSIIYRRSVSYQPFRRKRGTQRKIRG